MAQHTRPLYLSTTSLATMLEAAERAQRHMGLHDLVPLCGGEPDMAGLYRGELVALIAVVKAAFKDTP